MASFVEHEVDGFVVISTNADQCICPAAEPKLLKAISEAAAEVGKEFWPINIKIHDNPELGYKEYIAHEALTSFMRRQPGWNVTPSAYGLETAWVADEGIPGKIVLFGTPAEEGEGGKIRLLEAGAYSDHGVDISLISHPGIVPDAARMRTTAIERFKVEYYGREAHAAANPWLGINALDALVSAYNNVSMLRQQNMPGDIIQGYIAHGGVATNIIPAYACGHFAVRASSQARLEELRAKVYACFEAGATATGARMVLTRGGAYKDHVPNEELAQSFTRYFNALRPEHKILENAELDEARGTTLASTDQGDVSYAMPSLSPAFFITPGPEGQGPHNPEFAEAARTRDAYENAVRVGKGLAGVAVDVLSSKELLERAKKSWRDRMHAASRCTRGETRVMRNGHGYS
ncbi:Peptidase M20 domain-containing protein 2 [Metarhizium anisopliae]